MRLKTWLLAGTGLGMLAFTAAPAFAQGTEEVILAYQNYISAQRTGDPAVIASAETAFAQICSTMNFSVEDCVRAVEAGMFGPIEAAPPSTEHAPVQPAPVEPAPVEPAPMEAPPVESPPVEQPAAPDPMVEFQNQLNAELGNYQTALGLAAAGDYANAQPMADAAASNILALCTSAGYPSIEACIGQSLPPLPQPAIEPAPVEPAPVEPAPVEPAHEPAPVEPAPVEPAPVEQPQQPAQPDPMVQLQGQLNAELGNYQTALDLAAAGDFANAQPMADAAASNILALCNSAGYPSIEACIGQSLPPLPTPQPVEPAPVEPAPVEPAPVEPIPLEPAPVETPTVSDTPVAPVEQPPVIIPEQLLDQEVTPEAVETLPADILPSEAAPLLDSIKDAFGIDPGTFVTPTEPALPPPTSDADAQSFAPIELPPVDAMTGEAIEAPLQLGIQQSPDAQVTEQQSGGFVIELNTGLYFENPEQERDRIWDQNEDEIFYERLSRGRIKETIVRPNGVQIVTIRDANGDVLRRSRIMPDGREYVLAYYDEEDDFIDYQDPGEDLPPLILNIPARDYVLDARDVDEADVADFFSQPPVEQVRRIYSIEEVKRSARIRDSVRRLEIGGLTFDSGKATISRSQVGALSNVANAMLFLLDRNPAETFLIEGHTDAVGSEISNLGLSDLRASTIARILTDFYGIPPENLVTQGYGERYLKVRTLEAERLNRRVTVRRITPLITLASN